MSIEIDLRDKFGEKPENYIDPRVKVRFGFLIRSCENDDDKNIDLKLREHAQTDSPGASLSDLIKRMIKEVAFSQFRLNLDEFIHRFKKNNLADLIATKFANSLISVDSDIKYLDQNSDQQVDGQLRNLEKQVLLNTVLFLERYNLTGAETLFEFFKQQKDDAPDVSISKLFLEEYIETGEDGVKRKMTLREKVSEKIKDNIDRIANEAYFEKFSEDKRGFVMAYIMGRVIKYSVQDKRMIFDYKEFLALMKYLDNVGYSINRMNGETLYDWLYSDSRQMAVYAREHKLHSLNLEIKNQIKDVLGESKIEDISEKRDVLFFEENFDVKAFHDKFIKPALFKFYSKKLNSVSKIREPDIFHKLNDPKNLAQINYTTQLMRYIETLINTVKEDRQIFVSKIREIFGLNNSPLLNKLHNKEVEEYFAYCLRKAEDKFRRTLGDALMYRRDTDIHQACVYPEEILKQRDLATLLEWFHNPKLFVDTFPKYKDTPLDQITFACSAFLRDFLKISKKLSNKKFIEATERRDILEKYIKKILKIKDLSEVDVDFYLLEEVSEDGQLLEKPNYEVIFDDKNIQQFSLNDNNKVGLDSIQSGQKFLDMNGKNFLIHPKESKHFKKVRLEIPFIPIVESTHKKKKNKFGRKDYKYIEALIYTGDTHYIHVKDEIARIVSEDRGKEVSDENRWMLVFSNADDLNVFREFLYSNHARDLIKADDPAEYRNISTKNFVPKRSKSSSKFKQTQEFSIAKIFSFPEKLKDGKIQMVDTMLETQCQNLRSLLIYNLSDYSNTSHHSYRSSRAWPLLFNLYFPPEYFGDKFKDFERQGFNPK